MLLSIDIGNTNIVFGIHQNKKWLDHWRIQTNQLKTAHEYEIIFRSLLSAGKICRSTIHQIILSTVVPSLLRTFEEMLSRLFSEATLHIVNPNIYSKLPIKIVNPYEIGTDLVANAVFAFQKYGKNTMVIDFGTALTFTTIGAHAEIRGVAIAPGLKTATNALAGNAAQLPQINLKTPPSVLGKNTLHAIQAGIIYGFTGLVDSIIERTEDELHEKLTVIATGGLSSVIAPLTKKIKRIEPMLTLEGLVTIHSFLKQ